MSTAPSPPGAPPPPPPPAKREITLISHSMLFYWWPIWLLGFTMAAVTYFEKDRLAILPEGSTVSHLRTDDKGNTYYELGVPGNHTTTSLSEAVEKSKPTPARSG